MEGASELRVRSYVDYSKVYHPPQHNGQDLIDYIPSTEYVHSILLGVKSAPMDHFEACHPSGNPRGWEIAEFGCCTRIA